MGFKDFLNRFRLPKKAGKLANESSQMQGVRGYLLEFFNLEGTPAYRLEQQLTVGSSAGDIVIDNPALSPRHASFILNDGVVSVMDHGSIQGTKINGELIPRGRFIILEDEDVVTLGEIQVRTVVDYSEQELAQKPAIENSDDEDEIIEPAEMATPPPHPEPEMTEVTEEVEEDASEVEEEFEAEEKEQGPKMSFIGKIKQRLAKFKKKPEEKKPAPQVMKKPAAKVIGGTGRGKSSNALLRVMGLLADFLLVGILLQMLSPFKEVQEAMAEWHDILVQMTGMLWNELQVLVQTNGVDIGFIIEMATGAYQLLEGELGLLQYVEVLFALRLVGALLFGVSLGSFLVGMRAGGNRYWSRPGAVIREVFGAFTWPIIIFDLPTLVSRRSLKEMVTWTQVITPSKASSFIYSLLVFPLLFAAVMLAPLFQGLDIRDSFEITLGKVAKAPAAVEGEKQVSSQWYNVSWRPLESQWSIYPEFLREQQKGKRSLTPYISLYSSQLTMNFKFMLTREFSWEKLLGLVTKHNPILQDKFPELSSFTMNSSLAAESGLKGKKASIPQLQNEIEQVLQMAFRLSPDNVYDHMMEYGPLIKGLIDFRSSLEEMIGDGAETWDIVRLGSTPTLRVSLTGTKPADILIPLTVDAGRVFKIEYENSKDYAKVRGVLYDELWNRIVWKYASAEDRSEADPLMVIDVVQAVADPTIRLTDQKASAIFGYYMEEGDRVLATTDDIRKRIYGHSLKETIQALEDVAKVAEAQNKVKKTDTPPDATTITNEESESQAALVLQLRARLEQLQAAFNASDVNFFRPPAVPANGISP